MTAVLRRAAVCALAFALAGCRFSLQGFPAPGGAVSGPTYSITAIFSDVLGLPEHAQVKLDGVVVGDVTSITARDQRAVIVMDVQKSLVLPAGTTAEIRFTTPLGENYVALHRPSAAQGGPPLADGATIPETRTRTAVTIEDTFSALSLLLTGGGLEQLKTIITELNSALDGHTADVRDLVTQLDTVVTALNARQSDIDKALDSLDSLATELDAQKDVVTSALQALVPALQILATETPQFAKLSTSLAQLGAVGTQVLDQSSSALLTDLRELSPVVDTLVSVRDQLAPFATDAVRFASLLEKAIPGGYLNLNGTLCLTLKGGPGTLPAPCDVRAVTAAARAGGERDGATFALETLLP